MERTKLSARMQKMQPTKDIKEGKGVVGYRMKMESSRQAMLVPFVSITNLQVRVIAPGVSRKSQPKNDDTLKMVYSIIHGRRKSV